MPLVALLLLIWALFGCAVVVMMIYGAFEHVAMNDAVMAAILATGTAFLASLARPVATSAAGDGYLRFSNLSFQAGLGCGPVPTIVWLPRYADERAITGPNDLDTDA